MLNENERGIVYLIKGKLKANDLTLSVGEALLIPYQAEVTFTGDAHFILLTAPPYNEPIRQWGPYVD